jgi:hypothetical protein
VPGPFRCVFAPLAVLAAGLIAAETGWSAPPQGAQGSSIRINVVQGGGQSLLIGSPATSDIVVEVVDSSGKPVPSVSVTFLLGPGGTTTDGLTVVFGNTDAQGRASARIRPTGQSGPWSIRVAASYQQQQATANIPLTNLTEAPRVEAPKPPAEGAQTRPPVVPSPSPVPAASGPAAKKSKTALIVVLIAAGAGGAAAAALGGGGKGSSSTSTNTGGGSTNTGSTGLTISLGSGSFGTPPGH